MKHLHITIHSLVACAALALVLTEASTARAEDSIWSGGVGKVLASDDLVACAYDATSINGIFTVKAKLQRRTSDGSPAFDPYTDPFTKLRVKMQCRNATTGVISSPASATSPTFADNATISCPANHVGVFIRCMLRSTDGSPFTYGGGSMGGDPCGNGVTGITLPAGSSNGYRGQITGYQSELNFRASAGNKLFNATPMQSAQVHGTDLGYMFYAGGSLWAGYGDTWANTWMTPVIPTNKRGAILFRTNDLNPADSNGLSFSWWWGSPSFATSVVPSCHNTFPCGEVTAIATAGFGLREGFNSRGILWFDSITNWLPFTSGVATLAWSTNGSPFARADWTPPPGSNPPLWSDASHFGAGAIWQDRLSGYVYLFGQRPYRANSPIRLARVPAKFASVMDRRQYEYWGGPGVGWIRDTNNPMAPSEGNYFGAAADIIPTSANVAPELSVAFDAYANRWIMLLVRDRGAATTAVELWQASAITGPWTKVTTGANNLPNASTPGGTWSPYHFFYGPYTSEHIMRGGGQSVYFQLSEWNGLPGFRPYNVGLWTFDVTRSATPGCAP
jgi:hypothetical protein